MLTEKQMDDFFRRLKGEEGCNFKKDEKGKVTWRCKGGNNKEKSIYILKKMEIPEKDMIEFLCLCDRYGGHCDCEILFNAEERVRG